MKKKSKINEYNDEDSPLISNQKDNNNSTKNDNKKLKYFNDDNIIIPFFKNDKSSRSLRMKITLCWAMLSIFSGFFILKVVFHLSVGRSIFVAVATMTTIGYGPVINSNNYEHLYFLSGYFVLSVFPFTILQAINICDSMQSNAELIHDRINKKINFDKEGDSIILFRNEALFTILASFFILLLLLIIGTITYRYITSDQKNWASSFFNSSATVTTIGYGSFDIENEYGYYLFSLFAILCNFSVSVILSNIGSLIIAAGQNLDDNYIQKEESNYKSVDDRVNIAII